MSNVSHRSKRNCNKLFTLLILCLGLFSLIATAATAITQKVITPYAEEELQRQLKASGLSPFVHYETFDFDLLTLTPYLKNVQFGTKSAPWVTFEYISFNQLPITYPNLNIDFRIKNSTNNPLSRDTRHLMRVLGIDTLLGEGSIQSTVSGNDISSKLHLDINSVGNLSLNSDIYLQDQPISLFELRTDLLASMALGQPEAVLIIHGDYLNIKKMAIHYEDDGLINQLRSNSNTSDINLAHTIIEKMGLAKPHSSEGDFITTELTQFLQSPNHLTVLMSPPSPLSLKTLTLSAGDDVLYKDSQMSLSAQPEPNE